MRQHYGNSWLVTYFTHTVSRTINEATDQVFAIARQKLMPTWRENRRRIFEQILGRGFAPSGSAAIHKLAKVHEETIVEIAKGVEQQVRRIAEAYPADQVAHHEGEVRATFSNFVMECFKTAHTQLASTGGQQTVSDRNTAHRATMDWKTLERELVSNFDLMLMEAKKTGAAANAANVIYNVSGAGARVNVNSTDNSTNIITVNRGELFERLRRDIEAKVPAEQRPPILAQVDNMEKADSKPAMLGAYSEWVRLVASHASIIAAYVPAITQLLTA